MPNVEVVEEPAWPAGCAALSLYQEEVMKTGILVAGLFALALSACQGRSGQVETAQGQGPAPGSDSGFSQGYVAVVLPADVELGFEFELTGDRVYARHGSPDARRGIMLEFFDGEPSGVSQSVADSFSKAGYIAKTLPSADSGRTFVLTKKGAQDIRVEVRDAGSRKLRNKNARGTIWMSWSIRLPK